MTTVAYYIIFLLKILPTALLAASCPFTQYSGRFMSEDYENNKAIIGHSYKNLTITYVQQCFGYCVYDCKCLSFQVFGTRCELLDEDKNTFSRVGYMYYVLKQHFKNKYNSINCPGGCRNGCCHTNPCMNGGTCVETCDDVRRKFKCNCPLGVQGRYCQFIVSCAGIPGKRRKSGIYTITRPSLTSHFKVYCDFTSEPEYIWTLVESFEYSKKGDYLNRKFFENHPVSESSPNWIDYRLSLEDMTHIRTNATHWRATCNFDSANISTTDYVRMTMKKQDLMQKVSQSCYSIAFLRLLGKTCTEKCKSYFNHNFYHPYFAPCFDKDCELVSGCSDANYEAFGSYYTISNKHDCSSSSSSTTNWWIGYKLK